MKKRIAAVACALMMTFSMAVNVMAAPSPTGNRDTTTSKGGSSDAPKTGEGDLLIYGLAAALLFSGAAVVSQKRLKSAK